MQNFNQNLGLTEIVIRIGFGRTLACGNNWSLTSAKWKINNLAIIGLSLAVHFGCRPNIRLSLPYFHGRKPRQSEHVQFLVLLWIKDFKKKEKKVITSKLPSLFSDFELMTKKKGHYLSARQEFSDQV